MAIVVGTDTYATATEAKVIIAKYPNSDGFIALTDIEIEQWLVDAIIPIEADNIKGTKYSSEQILEYPRTWYLDIDTAGSVSDRVKEAQCLEAFERYLMNLTQSVNLINKKFGLKKAKVRNAEREYLEDGFYTRRFDEDNFYSNRAKSKLQPYRIISASRW